ncbi:hypothetical protein B0T24DRAFT_707144 [Lasiosphaeria ovina]|uniref:Prion-inhibition and propagation HeLo domain-containing protein n=1 Tax=Lasiosphaeria ovina TaxID=92902 RepID=A0AAE0K2Q4_9PEZI|nr:hypothetical protein B0T24DRAFT_707144 [Lasiosphaeria ovina]
MAEFAVATVLAVLPLVLSAFDQYAEMATNFKTVSHYSSELRELDLVMRTQNWPGNSSYNEAISCWTGSSSATLTWGGGIIQFTRKVKLSLAKTELKKMIQNLRDSVSDFKTLSSQIRARIGSTRTHPRDHSATLEAPKAEPKSLETYRRIRAASSKLYDIMRCSCVSHHRHLISTSLLDHAALQQNPQKAVFSLAISSFHHSNPDPTKSIILEVESHRQAAALASRPGPADQKASTFSVRLLSPQVRDERVSDPASHPSHGATASDGSRPGQDMEITGDMCRRLEELVGSDQTSKRYIRGPDDHGFEADGTMRRVPWSSLASLAGSLAHAVLQYHSTPWLPGTWKSHDQQQRADPRQMHTHTLLPTPVDSTTNPAMRESLSAGTARNEMLFHLGVVLLELRDRMGLKYCRIVHKCLACDFGLGEDNFADADLQGAFLVDVVVALERAEQVLRELDM